MHTHTHTHTHTHKHARTHTTQAISMFINYLYNKMPFVSKNASHLYIARNTHKLQLFKRTVQNSTSLADCVGPGVLQTFSTCAVKP